MTYRGKYPTRIKAVSSCMGRYPGACYVTTNAGQSALVYGRENTAPLKPGKMPELGHELAFFNHHPMQDGVPQAMVSATLRRSAKGVKVWSDGGPRFGVSLYQQGPDRFTVIYGFQYRDGLTFEDAARELGGCVMHAAECSIWPKS